MTDHSHPTPRSGRALRLCVGLLMATVAAVGHAAGTVELRFTGAERYTDAGYDSTERERTLQALSRHMQGWAERLPAGQRLEIEVLDVDLAGEQRQNLRHPELRILRGGADWPRMQLRWTLSQGGQVLKQGEGWISDKAYLMFDARLRKDEALSHERRMLDDWLNREVMAAAR